MSTVTAVDPPAPALLQSSLERPPSAWLSEPAGAFTASLLVPGAGQAALGLRRWPVYLLLEAGFWWGWADARGDVRDLRRSYRDLAWETARLFDGPRQDGGWGYYEAMSQYTASGRYDADPADGLQPEEDQGTYNGSIWSLARSLYLPDGTADPGAPEYGRALGYYSERAAGPEFLWSWEGREDDLSRFRSLIGSADDASRTATGLAGLILANHLVSAIDALVVARLRAGSGPRLESRLVPGPDRPLWHIELHIPLTR